MFTVQMLCPTEDRYVSTGLVVETADDFVAMQAQRIGSHCPACQKEHEWSDTDVTLAN